MLFSRDRVEGLVVVTGWRLVVFLVVDGVKDGLGLTEDELSLPKPGPMVTLTLYPTSAPVLPIPHQ